MELKIDPEFRDAIQPLSPEEMAQLEANIKANGCRDALVVWDGVIVDGHHRYEICQRLAIPFSTVTMDFPDRASAKVWMLRNQLGRRNLNDYQRSEIALQLEDVLKEQAKERQGTRTDLEPVYDIVENFPQGEQGKTRDAIAKTAGVSGRTVDKVKEIRDDAIPKVQDLARAGAVSIHAASQIADLPEETQENWMSPEQIQAEKEAAEAEKDLDGGSHGTQ